MTILSDWELWACANEQLRQHGENASIFAAMRADELLEESDLDGVRNWLLIIDRIEQLLARPTGPLNRCRFHSPSTSRCRCSIMSCFGRLQLYRSLPACSRSQLSEGRAKGPPHQDANPTVCPISSYDERLAIRKAVQANRRAAA